MKRCHRIVLVVAVCLGIAHAAAAEDRFGRPAMAGSENPDDLVVESGDLRDHRGRSHGADAYVVGSEDPDDLVVESENPNDRVADTEDPDSMVESSTDLSDLGEDTGGTAAELAIVPMPEPPGPNADASVRAAWREVQTSASYFDTMNDAYQQMMDANYPRGERRAQLIAERNEAIQGANRARTHYREVADR